jgi:hypothetical protein
MSKKQIVLVVTIKDDVVDEAKAFTDVKAAEECFTLICLDHLANKDDMDMHLDDGYFMWTNGSVCITWPEIV